MSRHALMKGFGILLVVSIFGAAGLAAEYDSSYGGSYKKYPRDRKLHAKAPDRIIIAKKAKSGQIKGGFYRVPITLVYGKQRVKTTARYKKRRFTGYYEFKGISARYSMRVKALRIGWDLKARFTFLAGGTEPQTAIQRYRKRRKVRADERPRPVRKGVKKPAY